MIHAVKVLERVLTFPMALISAVENAAARRSRSEMVERILASLDHIGIERHAHVIVGSEQDRFLALYDSEGRRFHLIHDNGEGIAHARREQGFAFGDQWVEFGKKESEEHTYEHTSEMQSLMRSSKAVCGQ